MDTSELETADRPVLDLAARVADAEAGHGAAWGPGDVLAHLIINDRLISRALRSVLEGAAEPYDNADAITPAELRVLAGELGGPDRLAGGLAASSRELLELAGRLDEAQAATRLPVRIVDNGEVFIDRPIPVAGLLATQARAHLPMHQRQLSELWGLP